MTYTELAIQNAIEGGYEIPAWAYAGWRRDGLNEESVFLDPLFWQSLGKSLGWDANEGAEMITIEKESNHDVHFRRIPESTAQWHLFIENIAEGKSAESFFKSLLSA